MSIQENITLPMNEIADFCRQHRIQKLSLFGSVLGDEFSDDSDIDVLVEFEPDAVIGWKIVSMQAELQNILGREVDFLTPASLSPTFRDEVIAHAQVIYEQPR